LPEKIVGVVPFVVLTSLYHRVDLVGFTFSTCFHSPPSPPLPNMYLTYLGFLRQIRVFVSRIQSCGWIQVGSVRTPK
jgi:hypothetical protein